MGFDLCPAAAYNAIPAFEKPDAHAARVRDKAAREKRKPS